MPLSSEKNKLNTIYKQKTHWTSNSTSAKTAGITHCLYNNLPIILISVYNLMRSIIDTKNQFAMRQHCSEKQSLLQIKPVSPKFNIKRKFSLFIYKHTVILAPVLRTWCCVNTIFLKIFDFITLVTFLLAIMCWNCIEGLKFDHIWSFKGSRG